MNTARLAALLAICAALCAMPARAATNYVTNVVIMANTAWTDTVYDVAGDLTVSNGAALTVAGGATITVQEHLRMAGSNAAIICQGKNTTSTNALGNGSAWA